jgi:hypothetical protein
MKMPRCPAHNIKGDRFMAYSERIKATAAKYNPPSQSKGELTKSIDDYTGSISSSVFLAVALGAMAVSLLLQETGNGKWGNLVAQWVPTWLLLGLYSKLIKLEEDESDSGDRGSYFL